MRYSRPSAVYANDLTRLKAVWVGILDVGDVPPNLVYCGKRRGDGGEKGDGGPLHVENKPLLTRGGGSLQHSRRGDAGRGRRAAGEIRYERGRGGDASEGPHMNVRHFWERVIRRMG